MNAANLKGILFWIPTLILSLLTLFLLIWLELRPEATLHEFAADGDLKSLQKIIATNPDINALNKEGFTPLACAVTAEQADAVKLLLMAGADVNGLARDGSIALHYAVLQDHLEMVTVLVNTGADIYLKNQAGDSPLCLAIQRNGAVILLFLEREVELSQAIPKIGLDCPGPFFHAAASGCLPVILKMLPDESDINRRSALGITALMYAVHNGHTEVARILIENGADVNAAGRHIWTSLHQAVWAGHSKLIGMLVENGAELEARDNDERTPLLLAAQRGCVDEVRELVNAGADIDVEDEEKRGVEDFARAAHHIEILEFMKAHRQNLRECIKESMSVF